MNDGEQGRKSWNDGERWRTRAKELERWQMIYFNLLNQKQKFKRNIVLWNVEIPKNVEFPQIPNFNICEG